MIANFDSLLNMLPQLHNYVERSVPFLYILEKNNKRTRTRTIAHFTFYLATAF